ncbi:hypothetical protein HaLaN_02495 [Haematococcus lacustris]|uniref:Uncharacterized protein n=1 Tax=Haematococcus lacustris TaxID=44745 RepID=A0A699YC85_HAELA|nr:hypothetical protein HaLaN_02495 [Haematococcus lacustris]
MALHGQLRHVLVHVHGAGQDQLRRAEEIHVQFDGCTCKKHGKVLVIRVTAVVPTPPAVPPWQQLAAGVGASPDPLTPPAEQQGVRAELDTSSTRKRRAGGRDQTQHVEQGNVAMAYTMRLPPHTGWPGSRYYSRRGQAMQQPCIFPSMGGGASLHRFGVPCDSISLRRLSLTACRCSWARSVAAVSRDEARLSKIGKNLNVKEKQNMSAPTCLCATATARCRLHTSRDCPDPSNADVRSSSKRVHITCKALSLKHGRHLAPEPCGNERWVIVADREKGARGGAGAGPATAVASGSEAQTQERRVAGAQGVGAETEPAKETGIKTAAGSEEAGAAPPPMNAEPPTSPAALPPTAPFSVAPAPPPAPNSAEAALEEKRRRLEAWKAKKAAEGSLLTATTATTSSAPPPPSSSKAGSWAACTDPAPSLPSRAAPPPHTSTPSQPVTGAVSSAAAQPAACWVPWEGAAEGLTHGSQAPALGGKPGTDPAAGLGGGLGVGGRIGLDGYVVPDAVAARKAKADEEEAALQAQKRVEMEARMTWAMGGIGMASGSACNQDKHNTSV